MNPTNILPIIIANNANSHGVHSELAAICMLVGYAAIALFVVIFFGRMFVLDFFDRRARARRDAVFATLKAENDPALANDWRLFRAELERRLSR